MELLGQRGMQILRRRKWIVLLLTSYGAYKFYYLPSVVRKRRKLSILFNAFFSIAEMVSNSAEVVNLVSTDLKEFLTSKSDEIPNSLKQISKLINSHEFSESISRVSHAITTGVLTGYRLETRVSGSSFSDRVMDKILSPDGRGFVSVIVGSFARNLVMGFCSNPVMSKGSEAWLDVLSSSRSKEIVVECIHTFVSTLVSVYLERTANINTYDEFFSGLTNPKHQKEMKDILVSVCKGSVETMIRTAHGVMSTSSYKSKEFKDSSCGGGVLSTLTVPRNKRFLVEVGGKVTFETMKAFVDFFLFRLFYCLRRGVGVVHDEVVDRGLQVVQYVSGKSSIIVAICVALYLHLLSNNTMFLLPA